MMDYKHMLTGYLDKNGKEICEGHMIKCHIKIWVDAEEDWHQFDLILTCCHVDSIEFWVFRCDKPFTAAYIWEEIKDGNPKIIGKDGLRFCPFCGGEAVIRHGIISDDNIYVECVECNSCSGIFHEEGEAITAWNMRFEGCS